MAYAKIHVTNGIDIKVAPIGFSWTTLFFGFIPALIRGDWKWAVIQLICSILSYGLSGFVFMFIYNKLYAKDLLNKGFKVMKIDGAVDEKIKSDLGLFEIPMHQKIEA